jgi:hypothetical protein
MKIGVTYMAIFFKPSVAKHPLELYMAAGLGDIDEFRRGNAYFGQRRRMIAYHHGANREFMILQPYGLLESTGIELPAGGLCIHRKLREENGVIFRQP